MNVICHTTNFNGYSTDAFDNATHVWEDSCQVFLPHLYSCTFHVEDEMHVNFY